MCYKFVSDNEKTNASRYIGIILIAVMFLLLGCSQQDKNENLELENITWGMTVDEVLEIYGKSKNDVTSVRENPYDSYFTIEDGTEVLGEKTQKIIFSFVDASVDGRRQGLCSIQVIYPNDADMGAVRHEMQQSFGDTVSRITRYQPNQLPEVEELPPMDAFETNEKRDFWIGKTVKDVVPNGKEDEYEELWEKYQGGLSKENWKEFSENSYLVMAICASGENAFPMFEKNGIYLDAYNLAVHNSIMQQLEDAK